MKATFPALGLLAFTIAWAGPQAKPGDARAHFDRAKALYGKGDLDGAIAELRQAIRLRPGFAEAHYGLGKALDGKGDHKSAFTGYREAVRLKPDFPEAHLSLGGAL